MKSFRILCITSVLLFLFLAARALAGGPEGGGGFIENKGPIVDQYGNPNPDVLYLYNGPGLNIQLRKGGFSYDTYTVENELISAGGEGKMLEEGLPWDRFDQPEYRANYKFHRIDVELIGANLDTEIITGEASSDYTNYYNVISRLEGVLFVRTYRWVLYKNIYPNTDLEFITEAVTGKVKCNFILHPGADIGMIKMKYKGAPILPDQSRKGVLLIQTSNGTLEEQLPDSYFDYGNKRENTEVVYTQLGEGAYGFALGDNLVLSSNATLIIDPIPVRMWGTYYVGSFYDFGEDVSADPAGNVYMAGYIGSSNNILLQERTRLFF